MAVIYLTRNWPEKKIFWPEDDPNNKYFDPLLAREKKLGARTDPGKKKGPRTRTELKKRDPTQPFLIQFSSMQDAL